VKRVPTIAAVGEICEDVYLPEQVRRAGGISANFAHHAARSGARALLFGAIGTDEAGDRLVSALGATAVDVQGVRRLAGASTTQKLTLDRGERVFCGYEPGVARHYRLGAEERERLATCDAIACSDGLPELLADCQTIGPPVFVDFSQDTAGNVPGRPAEWIRPWLPRLHVAFVGGTPAFREILAQLARGSDVLVVLTAAAHGAFAFRAGESYEQPSLVDELVDTNGCGDAFQAGFAAAWLAGASIPVALEAGARTAARVAGALGAQPA
jgi:sugar/nucleoside kinase (ribokinase family)